jgi:hypothetical protein
MTIQSFKALFMLTETGKGEEATREANCAVSNVIVISIVNM